jgi:hypothetical protein
METFSITVKRIKIYMSEGNKYTNECEESNN